MSNLVPNQKIYHSRAIHEPLPFYAVHSTLPLVNSQYHVEQQSASVTASGQLWQRALTLLEHINTPVLPSHGLNETPKRYYEKQIQKNSALIQLLKSWREGDEQEQHETLEYLKQSLDEDRPSDRKLFK